MITEFNDLKRKLLETEFNHLNDMQQKAVFTSKGHTLILAGAGSGKTTTVVNKIAYMIKYGNAYDPSSSLPQGVDENTLAYMRAFADGGMAPDDFIAEKIRSNPVKPYNILAFTFTNKAANEMKERIAAVAGAEAADMWIGTFHSICVKILRRNIDKIFGYNSNFVIYDTADAKTLVKTCIHQLGFNEKDYKPADILGYIGSAKDKLMSPDDFLETADSYRLENIGRIFQLYQQKLREYNALDFDEIICLTVKLLTEYPDVREKIAGKFHYVLVDEYQDTNKAQYELISALASGHGNLCVVGDDDQSIYGWRGADIQNIIDFEDNYKNCTVIKLEQNYRSTSIILDAANEVIKNNTNRKDKKLWTSAPGGDKIALYERDDERDEANGIAADIEKLCLDEAQQYSDVAVLYRTHTQSRAIEDALIKNAIPYRIVGGLKFYDHKEIKDLVAYLKIIVNPADNISLKRIINVPKRGIGDSTVEKLEQLATEKGVSMLDAIADIDDGKTKTKLGSFYELYEKLKNFCSANLPSKAIDEIINELNLQEEYIKEGEIEAQTRMENLEELISVAAEYEEKDGITTVSEFLEYTTLMTDTDVTEEDDDNTVTLMTIHAAKGLEFTYVFLPGCEEEVFPKIVDEEDTESELEEERRLFYVALTRAKKKMTLSYANSRMMYGRTQYHFPSRFIDEIPARLIDKEIKVKEKAYTSGFSSSGFTMPDIYSKPSKPASFKYNTMPKQSLKTDYKDKTSYSVGDKVSHVKFGVGTVAEVNASDAMTVLTIDFETCGRKNIVSKAVKPLE